jgi:hypothetical protein
VEVAVAGLPARVFVAGDDVHLHVAGEQVVAGVHAAVGHLLQEIRPHDPLAHEAAVHVGEDGEHGLDLAALDEVAQLFPGQHAAHGLLSHCTS